jgi:hypothetical protein
MRIVVLAIASFLYVIGMYIALPAVMIWGWVRWEKRTQPRNLSSILSLIGLALATASCLLAISSVVYARAIGGFSYNAPSLLRIYRCGSYLSLAAIIFAVSGVWHPNPQRWHALAGAIGMLLYWSISAMGE